MTGTTRNPHWRRYLSRAAPWIIAAILLVIALRAVPFWELVDTLRHFTWWQIIILLLLNSAIVLLFAGRWWIVLRAMNQVVGYLRLSAYRLSAFATSYFTPGTQFGGEPLQVLLLYRHEKVPGSIGAASVALDKTIELIGNFTFLVFGAFVIVRLGLFSDQSGYLLQLIALGLLVLPLLFLIASWQGWRPLSRLLGVIPANLIARITILTRLNGLFAEIENEVINFCQEHVVSLAGAMLVSLVTWIALIIEYWLMLSFLGVKLDLLETVSVLTIARFSFLIPLPGAIGVLEIGQILALNSLGYTSAEGLSLALLIRARDLAFGSLGLLLGSVLLGSKSDR